MPLNNKTCFMVVLTPLLFGCASLALAQDAPPPDLPAGQGPRGTSGAAKFDQGGRVAIGPEHGMNAVVNGIPDGAFAEVTALDSGKTVLVLAAAGTPPRGRLAELSAQAANALGVTQDGALIRVRRVDPPPQDQTALRAGQPASPRLDTPIALLAPLRHQLEGEKPAPVAAVAAGSTSSAPTAKPATKPTTTAVKSPPPAKTKPSPPLKPAPAAPTPAAKGEYFVQVAAVSNRARADALAKQLGGAVQPAGKLWRVRLGPFGDAATASRARDGAAKRGYGDARVIHD